MSLIIQTTAILSFAQQYPINVNVSVTPPYTSSISDYLNIPNKIIITLTNTTIGADDIDLYLKVAIRGDNGVSAISEPDYKPVNPITIKSGSSYMVNIDNISEAFNLKHIVIEGIALTDLITGAGLPEGAYQICVTAYDFNTRQPLSLEEPLGCSNFFMVTNLDPPVFNVSYCGDIYTSLGQQAVNVSWIQPSAVTPGASYHFEMVEVPDNVDIDPNEAFLTAKFPVLYEEWLTQTMTVLTVDKVSLNPGYTYVMRVTIEDPQGISHFRNNGTSEVCSFKYEVQQTDLTGNEKYIRFVRPAYDNPDSLLTADQATGFYTSWRVEPFDSLIYKDTLDNFPGCEFLVEFFSDKKGKTLIFSETTKETYYKADPLTEDLPFESGKSYWEKVSLINTVSKEEILSSDLIAFKYQWENIAAGMKQYTLSGKIEYKFEKDDPALYPASEAQVKIIVGYLLNDTINNVKIPVPEENIPSEFLSTESISITAQPLASGTTAVNGNFNLMFFLPEKVSPGIVKKEFTYNYEGKEYTGDLILYLKPVLDNPYYSGINEIITYNQNSYDLGSLTTYVYSYKLNANIYEGYSDVPDIKKNLENRLVYILRKNKKPGLPLYEGNRFNNTSNYLVPAEISSAGYSVVSSGKTELGKDSNGKDAAMVSFTRLIQNLVNGDDYYLWIKGTNITTVEPFRYCVSMAPSGEGNNIEINGIDYSINKSISTENKSSGNKRSNSYSSSNILGMNGNNYILGEDDANQDDGGNEYSMGQSFTSNFEIDEFDFLQDKITEEIGVFSDITQYSFTVESGFTVISDLPPMSEISGRIVYEFPAKAGNSRPLNNRKISLISCLVTDEEGEASKMIKTQDNSKNPGAFPGVYPLFTGQTDANGYFKFSFPNIIPNNANEDPKDGQYDVSTGNLNRDHSWTSWESDPGKEFEIVYEKRSGKVKRVLRIVIEDEAGIFLSPCENFEIEPLKSADVGTIKAEVFSYKLKGGLNYKDPEAEKNVGQTNYNDETHTTTTILANLDYLPIKGAECYVLRSNDQINQYDLPADEGQNIVGILDEFPDFKIIAKYTTGSQGEFEFDNLIFRNATAPVFLHFRTRDMGGLIRFEPLTVTPKVNAFAKPAYFFRNDYNYSEITGFSSDLIPANPSLKGRVVSNVNIQKGLNEAVAYLTIKFDGAPEYKNHILTDTTGKFDFTADFEYLANNHLLEKIDNVNLRVGKYKFHYLENGEKKVRWENNWDKKFFQMGRQVVCEIITLNANGLIRGRIINEGGVPVDAYVQFLENSTDKISVGEGEMHKTSSYMSMSQGANIGGLGGSSVSNGKFEIPAIPGNNRKLVVIPKDVAYFSDTIDINVLDGQTTELGDIKVYERSHRIYFFVKAAVSNLNQVYLPLKGAQVSIIGCSNIPPFVSDQDGKVVLNFKNVSETNLTLKVAGPSGSNYVPKSVSFTNEESENPVMLPTVTLEKGISLKGKVLLDGKPTPDAEVYIELSKNIQTEVDLNSTAEGQISESESQYLFSTRTKSDGTFEINTIPPELKNKKIVVNAVYKKSILNSSLFNTSGGKNTSESKSISENNDRSFESEKTIIGESKEVMIPNVSGNFTLNMTTFKDMIIKDLWGFPLEITKIEKLTNSNKVAVFGRVKPEGFSPGFDPLEPLELDVFYVVYQPSEEKINNVPVGIPVDSKIYIQSKRQIKLKYSKAFNVKLNTPDGTLLSIIKSNSSENYGKLNALVNIIDNSFQYPSSYLNFEGTDFYFCEIKKINNIPLYSSIIDVFNSKEKGNGSQTVKYNLCNVENGIAKDLKFSFINFNTTADIQKSYIEGEEITLNAVLHAKVKNAGDVDVEVGKIILKNNAIMPASGSTPVIVYLNDEGIYNADMAWKIEARNWRVDPKVGGLMSNDCTLKTGKIDIPISEFNLRSDFAYVGKADVKNLTMGGYKVTVDPEAETTTGFNQSCGSDSKGHWQLIIHPPLSGKTPAVVKNLPNMGADLQLETVSLLSNGEDVLTIGTGADPMKLYDVVDFKPSLASSLNDGLILGGSLNFHIPRVKSNLGTLLTFVKNAPDSINPRVDPIDIGFESKGNISFNVISSGQKFSFKNKTFTTYGIVEEVGKLYPIEVLLTYHSAPQINDITTTIVEYPRINNQKVNIGESKTYLEKIKCNMQADQNDWSLFTFEGDMAGFNGIDPETNKHMIFTVHGEIIAEKDSFKAEGIDADFGMMNISYHRGRLLGTLTMDKMPMGGAIVTGVANILMDQSGWAFYSNSTAEGVPAPEPTSVNMGILIGNYPTGITQEMSSTVLKYSVNKVLPETFNKGLMGFFMVGGRDLPLSGLDIGINLGVANAYVRIPVSAVDASFWGNFISGKEIGMSLNGQIIAEFGLGAITCTDLEGKGDIKVKAGGIIGENGLVFEGSGEFGTTLTVSQGIPTPLGCKDAISISKTISGGINFQFGTGSGLDANFFVNF